jgi:hypothetical protein
MWRQGGIRMFYRGCTVNALNSGPSTAINFVVYDYLNAAVNGKK